MVDISVNRLSDSTDIIPVMVSERLLDVGDDYKGMKICIVGQFRSYNRHEEPYLSCFSPFCLCICRNIPFLLVLYYQYIGNAMKLELSVIA